MTTFTLNAFDVRTPEQARDTMAAIVATYEALARNAQSTLDAQVRAGVDGAPLAYVSAMREASVAVLKSATASAEEFAREAQKLADTVGRGAGGSLAGTQTGGYADQGRGGMRRDAPSNGGLSGTHAGRQ